MVKGLTKFLNELFFHNGDPIEFTDMIKQVKFGNETYIVEFRNKMTFVCYCFKNIFFDDLADFFTRINMNRRNVFTLLATHCFKMCRDYGNIFMCLLYCCSFSLITLKFCTLTGFTYFSRMAPLCVEEIFKFIMEERFVEAGGMNGLYKFSVGPNLPEIVEFIELFYTDSSSFVTELIIDGEAEFYGLQDDCVYEDSVDVWREVEKKFFSFFDESLNYDARYVKNIKRSLLQVRLNLDKCVERVGAYNSDFTTDTD